LTVDSHYQKEVERIGDLGYDVIKHYESLIVFPQPEIFKGMSFEELQQYLQNVSWEVQSDISDGKYLCAFCISLGKISARCKRLRKYLVWNTMAVSKILKKWRKRHGSSEDLATVLGGSRWYSGNELTRIVSTRHHDR